MKVMLRRLASCLSLLTLVAAPVTALAQNKATPAARDWTKSVTLGANGAYILGNPNAPDKLVEYLSYTCPHCSAFAADGMPSLKNEWIKQGLVSIEYRNFVRDPFDLSAAMLARCGGAARFVGNHEALFTNYEPWMEKARQYKPPAKATAGNQVAEITDIADKSGLFQLLAKRGITPAAQRQCLADKQALSTVLNLTANAWDVKDFSGTPFFILNGKPLTGVHDWAGLRPLLPPLPSSGN